MDEDISGGTENSAERVSVGEAGEESDSTYLGGLPSLGTLNRSQCFGPEADDDSNTYEQNTEPQDNAKSEGFNSANPLSKLFWWWVVNIYIRSCYIMCYSEYFCTSCLC